MIDKNHCFLNIDGENIIEYKNFYDFRFIYLFF